MLPSEVDPTSVAIAPIAHSPAAMELTHDDVHAPRISLDRRRSRLKLSPEEDDSSIIAIWLIRLLMQQRSSNDDIGLVDLAAPGEQALPCRSRMNRRLFKSQSKLMVSGASHPPPPH